MNKDTYVYKEYTPSQVARSTELPSDQNSLKEKRVLFHLLYLQKDRQEGANGVSLGRDWEFHKQKVTNGKLSLLVVTANVTSEGAGHEEGLQMRS